MNPRAAALDLGRPGLVPYAEARRIVEYATAAPSVHNTQPWAWRIDGEVIELYADTDLRLLSEDPVGRNLVISCGAALHHLQVAAGSLGWSTAVDRVAGTSGSALLARIRLSPSGRAVDQAPLSTLGERRTDRRRFTSWPVPDARLQHLVGAANQWGCHAVAVLDDGVRVRMELLVETARASAAASGHRGLLPNSQPDLESTDGIIVLGGTGDDASAWLRTGEGLSALWLEATEGNLSVLPLCQPVAVEHTRLRLRREILGGLLMPHIVVRIGWQAIGRSEEPPSARRPVDDVLRP
jgi:hypothetical protein